MNNLNNLYFDDLMNRLPTIVVRNIKMTDQSPKWHKEGDVHIHTRMVFDLCKKIGDIDLMVAAIFHDLGKIDTHVAKLDKNGELKISHIGHEIKSLDYIDKYFHLYDDLTTNKDKIKEIVKNHMKIHLYLNGQMKKPSKREKLENNPYFEDMIKFTECDENGRIK